MAIADQPLLADEPEPQDESAQEEQTEQDSEPGDPLEGREDLQKALYTLYQALKSEQRWARMMQIKAIQQALLYWRSLQYWWWSQEDERWNLPNQNHGIQVMPDDEDDMPRFEFVTNIYQAFGLSLIAAISQAPPRTRWFPEDAEEPDDVETAEGNTKLAKIIEKWNPIQVQLQDEVFHLFTGGIVAGWARYVADDKFGTESIEDLEPEEAGGGDEVRCAKCGFTAPTDEIKLPGPCPKCGQPLTEDNVSPGGSAELPMSAGKSEVPKGREVVTVIGGMNFNATMTAKEQSEYLFCSYEEEIHYAKIRKAYPDIADKIKAGQAGGEDNEFERYARLAVMEGGTINPQTAEGTAVLNTFARVWFRTDAFYHDSVKKYRDDLLDTFPNGCRAFFSGEVYCESEDESMDEAWTVAHAIPGNGQNRPALGSTLISVQDRYNTYTNIAAETFEYGIPITYRDAGMFDEEADQEQRSEPGSTVSVNLKPGDNIQNKVLQVRNDSPSPEMMQHATELMGPVGQFLTGAFPALLGAGAAQGAAGDTAAGYKMQMDQALGRCGISYVRLKQFHADIETLACKDFCKHATGKVARPVLGDSGDFENESIDVTSLKGNARAYPEGDENYPELWSLQRAAFFEVMQHPMGQVLLTDPDNAELGVKLIGIPDMVLPGSDMKRWGMKVIGELTKVPDSAPMSPAADPDVIKAIIASEAGLDPPDHSALAQVAKHWLFSEVGLKCLKENPNGHANVGLWKKAEQTLVPPAPPQEKPLSKTLTLALDKMPPEAQAQILGKEYGVELSPEDFLAQAVLEKLKKTPKPPQAPPGLGANPPNPAVGA